jgi:hypothetical protein
MAIILATLFIAIGIVIVHSVAASTEGDDERKSNDGIDNPAANQNSDEKNKLEDNFVAIGLLIIIVVVALIGVYFNVRKTGPLPTEERVAPLFEPVFENYDHAAWSDSDSTWSKVNTEWESNTNDDQGQNYGSYDQQYDSLYDY